MLHYKREVLHAASQRATIRSGAASRRSSRRALVVAEGLCLLLLAAPAPAGEPPPKRVLLLGQGPDGHPRATHEYHAGLKILERCLRPIRQLDVRRIEADEPWAAGPEEIERAQGVVIYLAEGAKWTQADPRRYQALTRLAARRGGLVGLHWGVGCKERQPIAGFLALLGACHGGDDRKYQVLETDLQPADHPILRGIGRFRVRDEFYYRLKLAGGAPAPAPLLTARIDSQPQMVAWAWQRPDGGRSCGFTGLHFHDNWRRPEYRRLAAQAVLWSLDLEIPAGGLSVDVPESAYALPQR